MEPYADADCVLKVNVHCDACKMKMMGVLTSIVGVYSVTIDAEKGIAKISGEVDPNILLKALVRTGKHAELVWVKLNHPKVTRSNQDGHHYGSHNNSGSGNNYGSLEHPNHGGYREALARPLPGYSGTSDRDRYIPMQRMLPEYPSNGPNYYYPPPAVHVPSYPVNDHYEDEPISLCTIM